MRWALLLSLALWVAIYGVVAVVYEIVVRVW